MGGLKGPALGVRGGSQDWGAGKAQLSWQPVVGGVSKERDGGREVSTRGCVHIQTPASHLKIREAPWPQVCLESIFCPYETESS